MRLSRATLKAILPAASKDSSRFNLNGAYLEPDRITATDGHRIHQITFPDGEGRAPELEASILDRESIQTAVRTLKTGQTVDVSVADSNANGKLEGTVTDAKGVLRYQGITIDKLADAGDFPNYHQVIPDGTEVSISFGVNAQYLIDALKAAIDAGCRTPSGKTCPVKVTVIDGTHPIKLEATNADTGDEFLAIVMPMRL